VKPVVEKIRPLTAYQREVYVVDDDQDLRQSMQFLLRSNQIGATLFSGGMQFLKQLDGLRPAPILLDIRMPGIDGVAVLAQLSQRKNWWPVIMLTGHGEVAVAVNALKLGAHDFLEKPVKPEDLLQAIESALDRLSVKLSTDQSHAKAIRRVAALTRREFEVVSRLSAGSSNKQVALDLSLSSRTIEMHRANGFRHLEVRTLVEAAALLAEASIKN
jgi:two-component system response regulator FixJ